VVRFVLARKLRHVALVAFAVFGQLGVPNVVVHPHTDDENDHSESGNERPELMQSLQIGPLRRVPQNAKHFSHSPFLEGSLIGESCDSTSN